MAEADVPPEEKQRAAAEETYVRVSYTASGAERPEDKGDSAARPLLQHKRRDGRDEDHGADRRTATDAADRTASAPPREAEVARGRSGSGGSSRSASGRGNECPVCSERFDSRGDRRVALLHCDHTLCHHCVAGIMGRARDPGRLQCPLCRQTTPLPQWEIRRLQEESYSNGVQEAAPASVAVSPGPEARAADASPLCCVARGDAPGCCVHRASCLDRGPGLMRLHSLCFSTTALVLLLLVLLFAKHGRSSSNAIHTFQ
ncbi:hypothetical protein F2P81_015731 [Scophthalmus maximus]|uniref:E3 ubiquitin-protein ligase RNF182 n=1 Tax=Scophthalmus maximus TaxID=52904 RepID=A0A6A4S7J8_SCOMX|nr:hypothetical protein F2P81_015731 [Scophthalmus maximus]